jgi:hypothetical protein
MAEKTCRLCGLPKDEEDFYENRAKRPDGSVYVTRRTECRDCTDKRTRKYHRENRHIVVYGNCRKASRHRGLECDLTKEAVKELILRPCEYCGEDDPAAIGLDRAENSVGYVLSNVVPCCIRCNALKRDMPLQAWLQIAPTVKSVRLLGLFGEWVPHNKGSNEPGMKTRRGPKGPDARLRKRWPGVGGPFRLRS